MNRGKNIMPQIRKKIEEITQSELRPRKHQEIAGTVGGEGDPYPGNTNKSKLYNKVLRQYRAHDGLPLASAKTGKSWSGISFIGNLRQEERESKVPIEEQGPGSKASIKRQNKKANKTEEQRKQEERVRIQRQWNSLLRLASISQAFSYTLLVPWAF